MHRALIAILLVGGCSKKDDTFRPYTVGYESGGCIVAGLTDAPYAYDCGGSGRYKMAKQPHQDLKDPDLWHYARIGGECFKRPLACNERGCLGSAEDCPPAASDRPLPTYRWQVARTGDRCKLTPQAPTRITPAEQPFEIVCPPEYGNPVAVVWREGNTCHADSGEECPEGARCEPDIHEVPCPPARRR